MMTGRPPSRYASNGMVASNRDNSSSKSMRRSRVLELSGGLPIAMIVLGGVPYPLPPPSKPQKNGADVLTLRVERSFKFRHCEWPVTRKCWKAAIPLDEPLAQVQWGRGRRCFIYQLAQTLNVSGHKFSILAGGSSSVGQGTQASLCRNS